MENYTIVSSAKGPINIAVIKYWGKKDEESIIPLNNSISLTLDMDKFYTNTCISLIIKRIYNKEQFLDVNLSINGEKQEKISGRIIKIINIFLDKYLTSEIIKDLLNLNKDIEVKYNNNELYINNIRYKLIFDINSTNTVPTASGCASSASSMSAFVVALNKLFKLNIPKSTLSTIARLGSGSACRSIFGGIVEWNNDIAYTLFEPDYWKLSIKLIIVNSKSKSISSTIGMKLSKENSKLLQKRINGEVQKNIEQIKTAFINKDFSLFSDITIKDSNSLHSICLDTTPKIQYLTKDSEYIIKLIELFNKNSDGNREIAYTFDAGPNAFLIFEEKNKNKIDIFFDYMLYGKNNNENIDIKDIYREEYNELLNENKGIKEKYNIIDFKIGNGAN